MPCVEWDVEGYAVFVDRTDRFVQFGLKEAGESVVTPLPLAPPILCGSPLTRSVSTGVPEGRMNPLVRAMPPAAAERLPLVAGIVALGLPAVVQRFATLVLEVGQ